MFNGPRLREPVLGRGGAYLSLGFVGYGKEKLKEEWGVSWGRGDSER